MDYPSEWDMGKVLAAHFIRVWRIYEKDITLTRGVRIKKVAKHLGVSLKTVYNWLTKLEFTSSQTNLRFALRSDSKVILPDEDDLEGALQSIMPNLSL